MHIQRCHFKRLESSDWEVGIMIDWDKLIIDSKCQPVMPVVWNYSLDPDGGSIHINTEDNLVSIHAIKGRI